MRLRSILQRIVAFFVAVNKKFLNKKLFRKNLKLMRFLCFENVYRLWKNRLQQMVSQNENQTRFQ